MELRPGAPTGLVALVALPTAVLEPRPVSAPATRVAPPAANPVYAPNVDERGEAEPLGARRLVSRPPDEPPVEEWRWEGMTDGAAAAPTTPVEPLAPHEDLTAAASTTYDATAYDATAAPAYDAPTFDAPTYDARSYDAPASNGSAYDAPPAYDTPPAPPVYDETTYDAPAYDAPIADAPPVVDDAPPPPPPTPGPEEGGFYEAAPLPTRVPGQHLSHHPRLGNEAPEAVDDPMRAYRVHELLTRHAQGKRRGQTGEEFPPGAPSAPGAPAAQEDGT